MSLARFTIGTHSPTCSGCPSCSEAAARLLADPTNAALRAAVVQEGILRTSGASEDTEADIPDGYAAALSANRAAVDRAMSAASGYDPHGTPPDGYAGATLREAKASEDPNYEPHGTPPDGYVLALAQRERR